MAIELEIIWDGDVPGIAEHRLSIAKFGPALKELLAAYRRIASNMIGEAGEYAERGRLRELARLLDIEIATIDEGSLELGAVCTIQQPIGQMVMLDDILERSAKELLDCIKDESASRPRNASVRKYLNKLPSGLTRQTYSLSRGGVPLAEPVVIENVQIAVPLSLPYLSEIEQCDVVGVGFEPGSRSVSLKAGEKSTRFKSSADIVDAALELRGTESNALVVRGRENRLLKIAASTAPKFELTEAMRRRYIFEKWDGLLERLAK